MNYTLLIYESPASFALRTDPEKSADYWASWTPYAQALKDAGVFVGGSGLEPSDVATTVNLRSGGRRVQDGPYAATKEQLGGFFVIDVPHLDAAIEWSARCPIRPGDAIEVRPNLPSTIHGAQA